MNDSKVRSPVREGGSWGDRPLGTSSVVAWRADPWYPAYIWE
jgi:hypothetical protein